MCTHKYMLREFPKAPKTFCRAAARTEALSCSAEERLTATLPGPDYTVRSISTAT